LSDFKEVLDEEKNRFGISTFLFNCTLQGDAAIHSIIDALGKIERLLKHFDAIAIVRGGGAEVGMSCYDDYRLCKKIAEFPLPILCGIGHSTNLTVAEMVANSHAITPSVLANNILNTFEVAASNVQQSALRIQQSYKETQLSNKKSIHQAVLKISRIARWNLDTNRRALNQLSSNVYHIPRISLKRHQNLVMQMPHKLNQSLKSRSNREFQKTQNVWHKIQHGSSRLFLSRQYQLERLSKDLDLLDPKSVLFRGYSIVRKDHTILSSAKSLKKGDLIHVEFYEGKSDAEVK
jgi:exodeoxyribonuclease VII large subunit